MLVRDHQLFPVVLLLLALVLPLPLVATERVVSSRDSPYDDYRFVAYRPIDAVDLSNPEINGTVHLPFPSDRDDNGASLGARIDAADLGKDARVFVQVSVSENSTSAVNVTWLYSSDLSFPLTTEHVFVVAPGATMSKNVTLRAKEPPLDVVYSGWSVLELVNHSGQAWIGYHVKLLYEGSFDTPFDSWNIFATLVLAGIIVTTLTLDFFVLVTITRTKKNNGKRHE